MSNGAEQVDRRLHCRGCLRKSCAEPGAQVREPELALVRTGGF